MGDHVSPSKLPADVRGVVMHTGPIRQVATKLLFFVLLARCDAASELSMVDPTLPISSNTAAPCAPCFDQACGWEASECASDPGCARWITCARDCSADALGVPASACIDGCPDPESATGRIFRDVFVRCVAGSSGCCSAGGTGATATDASDGAAGSNGGGGGAAGTDSGSDPILPGTCVGENCEKCLMAVKTQNNCSQEDSACSNTMRDCYHENAPQGPRHCWSYLTTYATCATGASPPPNSTCSYQVPQEALALTARALDCAATYCSQCVPEPKRSCVSCQLTACPDEMDALFGSVDAQELVSCRERCTRETGRTDCRQECLAKHEQGALVVVELYKCSQESCKTPCEP